jgi:hypothetical protein
VEMELLLSHRLISVLWQQPVLCNLPIAGQPASFRNSQVTGQQVGTLSWSSPGRWQQQQQQCCCSHEYYFNMLCHARKSRGLALGHTPAPALTVSGAGGGRDLPRWALVGSNCDDCG